jgi:acyl-CoA synthetase (AMP-forming)/AMP-acid ligase II
MRESRSWLLRTLQTHAATQADAAAIVAPGRASLSYGGLLGLVRQTERRLRALGAGHDTRVVTVLPEGPEALTCAVAVASVATAAPLDPAYGVAEATDHISRLNADVVLAPLGAELPAVVAARALGIPVMRVSVAPAGAAGAFHWVDDEAGRLRQRSPTGDRCAFMLQTGGTTGRPKLVALSHRQVAASTESMARAWRLCPGDRSFVAMPMFHVHGLIGAGLTSLATGAGVIFPPALYPPRFGLWIKETRATWMTAAPVIFKMLLQYGRTELAALRRDHGLRFVRSCSAPFPSSLVPEVEELLGVPLIEAYGMTEAAHQIASNPMPPECRKIGSVGRPVGPAVAIIDPNGHRLPHGPAGEIVLRGPTVITRYERDDDATASDDHDAAFVDGWLRTGDLGAFDDDGYLFISGRLKDVINRGGEKIWPTEIEAVLERHHAIIEAAAFPIPHPVLGEAVAAAVVLRRPASVDSKDLSAFVAAHLSASKQPQQFVLLDRLPKTSAGKLDRRRLAATVGETISS